MVLFHNVFVPRIGFCPKRTETPMVELTGRTGDRDGKDWVEIRWFENKYKSFFDIFRNKTYRVEHVDWVERENILWIDGE